MTYDNSGDTDTLLKRVDDAVRQSSWVVRYLAVITTAEFVIIAAKSGWLG